MEESFESMSRLAQAEPNDEIWAELEKVVMQHIRNWRETNAAA
jgi:hypothetical protein